MMKKLFSVLLIFFCIAISSKAQTITKWKLNDLQSYLKNVSQPTVINFWATFCKPCVKEIPYFQEVVKKYKAEGVQFILVSLDLKEAYPGKIKLFAAQRKFTAPLYYLDETNADLFCPVVDRAWSGAIPASLFINNKKNYHRFFEEELSKEKFETELKAMLK